MGLQDKRTKIQNFEQNSRRYLCGVFIIFVATALVPIPETVVRIMSVGTSCLVLLGNIIRYRIEFGKHHVGLWCFYLVCVLIVVSCAVWPYLTLKICSVWTIYVYYLTGRKIMQGRIRRQSVLFCLCSCCTITASMCSKHVVVTGLVWALQFVILLRLADPALYMIAARHRDKRLQKGEEIAPDNVGFLRKIFFGQNGKLEIPGMER